MKKSISTLLFYFISVSLFSQKVYTPDWESLDKRPVPSWFEDANLVFLFTGDYTLCRDGRLKELIPNGISIGWKTRN